MINLLKNILLSDRKPAYHASPRDKCKLFFYRTPSQMISDESSGKQQLEKSGIHLLLRPSDNFSHTFIKNCFGDMERML